MRGRGDLQVREQPQQGHVGQRLAARGYDRKQFFALRLAHTEEFLDRRAVEVSGCHGTQGAEDFGKPMKPGGLGGHGGSSRSTTC